VAQRERQSVGSAPSLHERIAGLEPGQIEVQPRIARRRSQRRPQIGAALPEQRAGSLLAIDAGRRRRLPHADRLALPRPRAGEQRLRMARVQRQQRRGARGYLGRRRPRAAPPRPCAPGPSAPTPTSSRPWRRRPARRRRRRVRWPRAACASRSAAARDRAAAACAARRWPAQQRRGQESHGGYPCGEVERAVGHEARPHRPGRRWRCPRCSGRCASPPGRRHRPRDSRPARAGARRRDRRRHASPGTGRAAPRAGPARWRAGADRCARRGSTGARADARSAGGRK
jgi:hypothetical protein